MSPGSEALHLNLFHSNKDEIAKKLKFNVYFELFHSSLSLLFNFYVKISLFLSLEKSLASFVSIIADEKKLSLNFQGLQGNKILQVEKICCTIFILKYLNFHRISLS